MATFSSLIEWLDQFEILVSAVSLLVSCLIYLKMRRQERRNRQRIGIFLYDKDSRTRITLPERPERRHITRAEVQGLLGVLPVREKTRYALSYLNTREFFDRLARVQDQEDAVELVIECSTEELRQFDLDAVARQCEVIKES